MQIRKRVLAFIVILALLIGGVSTYVVMELIPFNDEAEQIDSGEQTITDADYEKMLDNLTEAITLPKVVQAYMTIQNEYIDTVTEDELVEGAIRGMLQTLEDPYSEYLDQQAMEQFTESIESSFEGIGAEVSMIDDRVTIVSPIVDSPAEKAGLRPNDRILRSEERRVGKESIYRRSRKA